MPRTAAFAAAAARGFGEFTSGLALTTVTFTANATWTAPPYVNNLLTMTGHGTNASSDDYSSDVSVSQIYRAQREIFSGATVATHDWSDIYNNLQAWISFINTGTPGARSTATVDSFYGPNYSINSDNTYNNYNSPTSPGSSGSNYFQINTGSDQSQFSVPSSGTITYANTPSGSNLVRFGYNPVYLGGNGTAATGVGQTFPGGTYNFATGIGGAAPTTNFSNIAVTPNLSYSIVVPSGASISISFYAPA
jgi:hypothetical protein